MNANHQLRAEQWGLSERQWLPPCGDSLRGLGQVQGGVLWDLDGLLHGSQQTLASFSSQGGAKTLWSSDEKFHHYVGVFFHTLTLGHECKEKKKTHEVSLNDTREKDTEAAGGYFTLSSTTHIY